MLLAREDFPAAATVIMAGLLKSGLSSDKLMVCDAP